MTPRFRRVATLAVLVIVLVLALVASLRPS